MSGFGGHAAAAPRRVHAHDQDAVGVLGAVAPIQAADPLIGPAIGAPRGQHR